MNYWVFQYTTGVYKNVVADFKNEKITKWEVTKHKKKIKKGDKAIIYIGGDSAKAVYGVVEIISNIYHVFEKERDYINIKIIENWSQYPLPFKLVKSKIPSLIIGISGTNFKANEKQYKELKKLL